MSAPWAEGNKAAAEHAQREIKLWEQLAGHQHIAVRRHHRIVSHHL